MPRLATPLLAALLAACGGGARQEPPQPVTLTITATGISPKAVTTRSQGKLVLVNGDTVNRQLQTTQADPCTELDSGSLVPGHSWETMLPVGPRTCGFRDAADPTNPAFQGAIEVVAPGVDPGGGY